MKTKTEIYDRFGHMLQNVYCGWGLSEDSGWNGLLWRLFETLDSVEDNELQVAQVKEKFGGLRFYVSDATERQDKAISEAESVSFYICEKCGTSHDVTTEGSWIKTLCTKCRDKHTRERAAQP